MKVLIIVDPQNDFIHGTLPVPNAADAMNRLAMALPSLEVDHIVVTMDCHPLDHMSFEEQGGPWPPHCMKYSEGAAIWAPLFQGIESKSRGSKIHFIEKGRERDREEYSAFERHYPRVLDQAKTIYLSGIAGNVCVLNSLRDLADHGLSKKLVVITDASPSLDDGCALAKMIEQTGVRVAKLEELIN